MENPPPGQESREIDLRTSTETFLSLPDRIQEHRVEGDIAKRLGSFLIDKRYIDEIKIWNGSWGFKYEDKKIFLADTEISLENYDRYIFRLGKNSETGEPLFPKPGDETDQYRFLHEVGHAYQDYLINDESVRGNINPSFWYDKASRGEIDSSFSLLFQFCYENRINDLNKGLSTWGNVPDYNSISHAASQAAIRAIEDANEMATMAVWHPEYLKTFLDYVSLKIPGYGLDNLDQDGLISLPPEKRVALEELLEMYLEEIKSNVQSG